jgi:hypothetical protein
MSQEMPKLMFQEEVLPRHKTKAYHVRSNINATYLGVISWWPHWRRYVFHPDSSTLYDVECLKEIVDFINKLMEDRKSAEQ